MRTLKSLPCLFAALVCLALSACSSSLGPASPPVSLDALPAYSGSPYVQINGGEPYFSDSALTATSFEEYSELDQLGRCGPAMASVGLDTMPTEERSEIGQVKPTGWQTVKYDCVDGKYLYNRCHLIGYQLTAENANKQNLITGTRYLNVTGMLPFENMVADYVQETGNHVLYRVTPIFEGNDLVAQGVLMEAKSVEDQGEGVCFNVFCYNVQPGVTIDYATGNSALEGSTIEQTETEYVINTNTGKFHLPSCSSAQQLDESNKQMTAESRQALLDQGYTPCGRCKP